MIIKAHQTQLPGQKLRGIKNTIAIGSGKGGVGKSTVTVNLAAALSAMGARVGILDADIYGPSIPKMLGVSKRPENQSVLQEPVFAHGIYAMSIAYLTENEDPLIWRGPMLAKALIQMINITNWQDLDYLLIDLPPGTGDIQLSLVQKIPLTGAIIVTTPQDVATIDAEKAYKMFRKTGIDVLGIVENMAFHICENCLHEETIFQGEGIQKFSEQYNCELLAKLPLNAEICKRADAGLPLSKEDKIAAGFFEVAEKITKIIAKKPILYEMPEVVCE